VDNYVNKRGSMSEAREMCHTITLTRHPSPSNPTQPNPHYLLTLNVLASCPLGGKAETDIQPDCPLDFPEISRRIQSNQVAQEARYVKKRDEDQR